MEQKDYKLEIVNALLKNKSHIRALAKKLNTNPMNIHRKINELSRNNVVDYLKEGKNYTYFLKKSIEAKMYVFIAEHYNLVSLLKRYPNLRSVIEDLQKNKRIKLAVLFGSFAKSIAKPHSDIDIYIETSDKSIKEEVSALDTKVSVKIGKYDLSSPLAKEIEKDHVIIKGVEQFYENNKFFG
jgi:predicted nucleotidyltransferase